MRVDVSWGSTACCYVPSGVSGEGNLVPLLEPCSVPPFYFPVCCVALRSAWALPVASFFCFSASSAPIKSYPCHPRILVRGARFYLNPIGGRSIHHQFVTPAITLIMPYQPTKVVEQLLWRLYNFLQQMLVIRGMFSSYLAYNTPQCRPRAWSCLSFHP